MPHYHVTKGETNAQSAMDPPGVLRVVNEQSKTQSHSLSIEISVCPIITIVDSRLIACSIFNFVLFKAATPAMKKESRTDLEFGDPHFKLSSTTDGKIIYPQFV